MTQRLENLIKEQTNYLGSKILLILEKHIERIDTKIDNIQNSFSKALEIYDKYLSEKFNKDIEEIKEQIKKDREDILKEISKVIEKENFIKKLFFIIGAIQTIIGGLFIFYKILL